jgi:hypothetical protein
LEPAELAKLKADAASQVVGVRAGGGIGSRSNRIVILIPPRREKDAHLSSRAGDGVAKR